MATTFQKCNINTSNVICYDSDALISDCTVIYKVFFSFSSSVSLVDRVWYLMVTFPDHCGLPCNAVFFCLLARLAQLVAHFSLRLEVCLFIGRANYL